MTSCLMEMIRTKVSIEVFLLWQEGVKRLFTKLDVYYSYCVFDTTHFCMLTGVFCILLKQV